MRILFLTPQLPYPPHSGYAIRISQLMRLLGRRHEVSLLSYAAADESDKVRAVAAFCRDVYTVPDPLAAQGAKRLAQLASLVSRTSYSGRYLYSDRMQRKLDDVSSKPFDLIQVETSHMAVFRFDRRSTVVLDEHDIVYELLGRISQTERSRLRRLYNRAEFTKYQREEIRRWNSVSACLVTSRKDAQTIQEAAPRTPVYPAFNGVDAEYFRPSDGPVDENAIVMTGLMKTRPNIDAATFFVRDVYPRILAERPTITFYIVGGDPPEEVTQLAGPNVVVTGAVSDVRPFVQKAAVFVVPMRMGGGTRLKVLEGLAMNKPMVSTTVGCEGIDVTHGEHLLVADSPAAFAQDVLRLLNDRELGARLARQGRALVVREYGWESIVESLDRFYGRLISEKTEKGGLFRKNS